MSKTKTTTIDICLDSATNKPGSPVLLTVTDAGAAQKIIDAINEAPKFQADHLVAFARTVDRDTDVPVQEAVTADVLAPDTTVSAAKIGRVSAPAKSDG